MNVANEIVSVTICGREPLESNQHVDSSPKKRTILLRTTANEKLCHCGRVLLESHNHVDSSPKETHIMKICQRNVVSFVDVCPLKAINMLTVPTKKCQ